MDAATALYGNFTQTYSVNIAGFPTAELPNEGYKFWLTLVIMIVVTGLFVCARTATRLASGQMGADDYAIIAALVR